MYVVSIHVTNADTQSESFGMIGTDFCPVGETDLKAESFATKDEAIEYLKSCGYEADGIYGNSWSIKIPESELTSFCQIWKVAQKGEGYEDNKIRIYQEADSNIQEQTNNISCS